MTTNLRTTQPQSTTTTTYTVVQVGKAVSAPPDLSALVSIEQATLTILAPDQDTSDEFVCALVHAGWEVREMVGTATTQDDLTGVVVTEPQPRHREQQTIAS